MKLEINYTPCARPSITRTMAEAISLIHGGKPVQYFDTQYKQQKEVNAYHLHMLDLDDVKIDGDKVRMQGYAAAVLARHVDDVKMNVLVNDITVSITKETTVDAAMAQYMNKYQASLRSNAD